MCHHVLAEWRFHSCLNQSRTCRGCSCPRRLIVWPEWLSRASIHDRTLLSCFRLLYTTQMQWRPSLVVIAHCRWDLRDICTYWTDIDPNKGRFGCRARHLNLRCASSKFIKSMHFIILVVVFDKLIIFLHCSLRHLCLFSHSQREYPFSNTSLSNNSDKDIHPSSCVTSVAPLCRSVYEINSRNYRCCFVDFPNLLQWGVERFYLSSCIIVTHLLKNIITIIVIRLLINRLFWLLLSLLFRFDKQYTIVCI